MIYEDDDDETEMDDIDIDYFSEIEEMREYLDYLRKEVKFNEEFIKSLKGLWGKK